MKTLILALSLLFAVSAFADNPTVHKPYAVSMVQRLDSCAQESIMLTALIEHAKTIDKHQDWQAYVNKQSNYVGARPDDIFHQLTSMAWINKDEDATTFGFGFYIDCRKNALLQSVP